MTEEERKETFIEGIMKRSKYDSTGNLEAVNQEWNGITLNGNSEEICQDLKKLIQKIEGFGLHINSEYVNIISIGPIPVGAGGGFDDVNKVIKVAPPAVVSPVGHIVLIHEYCHAIDLKHNVYLQFVDLYRKYAKELNLKLIEDERNPHKIFADFTPEQFRLAATGSMKYYRILSIKEFTAVALQNVYCEDYISEKDIQEKALEILKGLNLFSDDKKM